MPNDSILKSYAVKPYSVHQHYFATGSGESVSIKDKHHFLEISQLEIAEGVYQNNPQLVSQFFKGNEFIHFWEKLAFANMNNLYNECEVHDMADAMIKQRYPDARNPTQEDWRYFHQRHGINF